MRRSQVPASPESDGRSARVASAHPADLQAACGHARYTKGCDLCALAGIYRDHLSRPGLTPAERSAVIRLYLVGDKAGLFKLWQARRPDGDS
jgi:hypothetical protein